MSDWSIQKIWNIIEIIATTAKVMNLYVPNGQKIQNLYILLELGERHVIITGDILIGYLLHNYFNFLGSYAFMERASKRYGIVKM